MAFTWKLQNLDGVDSPLESRLDISFDETGRVEKKVELDALDQRVRVGALARRGYRRLSPRFGTMLYLRLTSKSVIGRSGPLITGDIQQFINDLKISQTDVQSRIFLKPIEIIDRATKLDVEEIDFGYFRGIINLRTRASQVQVRMG